MIASCPEILTNRTLILSLNTLGCFGIIVKTLPSQTLNSSVTLILINKNFHCLLTTIKNIRNDSVNDTELTDTELTEFIIKSLYLYTQTLKIHFLNRISY